MFQSLQYRKSQANFPVESGPRKTSPEYEPEEGAGPPVRAEEQRARLVGLLGTVQREKGEFNERVAAMRGRKRALIAELASIAEQGQNSIE